MKPINKSCGEIKSDRTPFLKFYTDDWIAGTIELTFEEKGFYFEILLRMWERKSTLPDDDKWLSLALGCNPRTVRKLLARLVETGKLMVQDGEISNRRMMREISTHLVRYQQQRELVEANSPVIEGEFAVNSTGRQVKNQAKSKGQKTLPEARLQKVEKEREEVTASPVLEPAMLARDLSEEMISNVAKWGGMPTANAQQWLTSTVATFGQEVTAKSYHRVITEKAEGRVISRPLATWSTIANRLKDEAKRGSSGKPWVEEKNARTRQTMQWAKEAGLIS